MTAAAVSGAITPTARADVVSTGGPLPGLGGVAVLDERYLQAIGIDVRNGTSRTSQAIIRTQYQNKPRKDFTKAQLVNRLGRLDRKTTKRLDAGAFAAIAAITRKMFVMLGRSDWQDVYRHTMFGVLDRSYAAVVSEIAVAESIPQDGLEAFPAKAFETMTEWFMTTEARQAKQFPDFRAPDEANRVRKLPRHLPRWMRGLDRRSREDAMAAMKKVVDDFTTTVVALHNQRQFDQMFQERQNVVKAMNAEGLTTADRRDLLSQHDALSVQINDMLERGVAVMTHSPQWRELQAKIVALNTDTGGGKSFSAVEMGFTFALQCVQFASIFHSSAKVREFYADVRKRVAACGDTDKKDIEALVERIVYRPGRGAPSVETYEVENGTPSKADILIRMCKRHDEAAALGSHGIFPDVMCGSCIFALDGSCEWQAFKASEAYATAIGILGSGAMWLSDPKALGADESGFDPLALVIDDMPLSGYFESYEIKANSFILPTIQEVTGKTPSDTSSKGEYELRRILSELAAMFASMTKQGLTRELLTRAGNPFHAEFDIDLILQRLDAYMTPPKEGRGEPGWAFKPAVTAVMQAMKQASVLKAFLGSVLKFQPPESFYREGASDPDRMFYNTRWSLDFESRGGKAVAHLTVVRELLQGRYTSTMILDGTMDPEVMRYLLNRKVHFAAQPRIAYGENTVVTQYIGSLQGKSSNTPITDKDRGALEERRTAFERAHRKALEAQNNGGATVMDLKRLDAAKAAYQKLQKSLAPRERSTKAHFIAASRRAIELNARVTDPKAKGRQLLVVTHKAQAEELERMRRLQGGDFLVLSSSMSRGLNAYDDVREVWVIGRPGTPVRQAIRYAAALKNEVLELESADHETRAYFMRDGTAVPAPMQEVLSDDLAQRILVQLTLADVYQALNRARPTTRQNDAIDIVIFTRAAIPWLFVDKLIDEEPLGHWGCETRQLTMTFVPEVPQGAGKYDAHARMLGIDGEAMRKRYARTQGSIAALDEMLALAADGSLARQGWGRYSLTLPALEKGAAPSEVVGWMPYAQGDLSAAQEAIALLVGGVAPTVTVAAAPLDCPPPDQVQGLACLEVEKIAEINSAHCPESDGQRTISVMSYYEKRPVAPEVGTVSDNYSETTPSTLDGLLSSGSAPLLGATGYAELVEFMLGGAVKAKTVRNSVSSDSELSARWEATVTKENCTHRVRLPGGRYAVPCLLTPADAAALELRDCAVLPIHTTTPPTDGPGKPSGRRGRPPKALAATLTTQAPAAAPDGPAAHPAAYAENGITTTMYADREAADAALLRAEAEFLKGRLELGENDIRFDGYEAGQVDELLAMARALRDASTASVPPN